MSYNVPDDWDQYYSSCSKCGRSTHASEDYRCGHCEAREEREERTPAYTLFTQCVSTDGSDFYRTETGYTHPKHFSFSSLEDAKIALAHHMFEGELSEDGLSKTFRDVDGTMITYKVGTSS